MLCALSCKSLLFLLIGEEKGRGEYREHRPAGACLMSSESPYGESEDWKYVLVLYGKAWGKLFVWIEALARPCIK